MSGLCPDNPGQVVFASANALGLPIPQCVRDSTFAVAVRLSQSRPLLREQSQEREPQTG